MITDFDEAKFQRRQNRGSLLCLLKVRNVNIVNLKWNALIWRIQTKTYVHLSIKIINTSVFMSEVFQYTEKIHSAKLHKTCENSKIYGRNFPTFGQDFPGCVQRPHFTDIIRFNRGEIKRFIFSHFCISCIKITFWS